MFRFSIRELILAALVATLGVAWVVEHRRAQAAVLAAKEAEEMSKTRFEFWKDQVAWIREGVLSYGLDIGASPEGLPVVYKIPADELAKRATERQPSR